MMNLSSLSSARLLNVSSLGVCVITGGVLFINGSWVSLAGVAVISACQIGAFLQIRKSESEIERMTETVSALAKGDFESRLTKITEKGAIW